MHLRKKVAFDYPQQARKVGAQGVVILRYQVQPDCTVTILEKIQGVHASCDRTAATVLEKHHRYLKTYGPSAACIAQIDTFRLRFELE